MLSFNARKGILGLILLGLSGVTYAEDLQLWQVSEKAPTFHHEPSASSKALKPLKTGQNMIVLSKQKDWVKLADLTTGEVGWIAEKEVKKIIKLQLVINQAPNAYQYQIKMHDSEGHQAGTWRMSGAFFEQSAGKEKGKATLREKLGFKSGDKSRQEFQKVVEKEFEEMEKLFPMMKMPWPTFSIIQPIVVVTDKSKTGEPETASKQAAHESSTQSVPAAKKEG